MRRFGLLAIALGLALPVLASAPANAQATRTWVSGVGDDVNPCSRTAPCKTFAGAISKTAAAGEINCIDSGAFGAVTITKSLTIFCEAGTAGVLATAGTSGIIVNAAAADRVTLKGLDIEGAGTGFKGIRFLAGAALIVEDTRINGFSATGGLGIEFIPTTPATLSVTNVSITRNGSLGAGSGGGISITANGASASARAMLNNVTIASNFVGLGVTSTGPFVTVQVMNSTISNNTNIGVVQSGSGTVRIGRSAITNNLAASSSGTVLSYLDNQINGNSPDVTPTSAGGYK